MNVSEFIAAFGKFYKEGNEVEIQKLTDVIFTASKTFEYFRPKSTNDTRKDYSGMSLTSVLQAFQSVFTARGTLSFTPNTVNLFRMKINLLETPDDIRETAADYLGGLGLLREEWKIAKLIGMYALMKAAEDFELFTAFKGKYVAPTAGTPSTLGTEGDGIRWQISKFDDAGTSNKVITGAAPSDPKNYVKWVEDFYKQIPLELRPYIDAICIADTRMDDYTWGCDELYNSNYDRTDIRYIKNTNVKVLGFPSQRGSDMIWTTPFQNRVAFVKNGENKNVFATYPKDVYQVQIASDWTQGLGFKYGELVIHNEQDLQVVP